MKSRWDYQITAGESDFEACFSPDGKGLAFSRIFSGPSKVMSMGIANPRRPGQPTRLTDWDEWINESSPSWLDPVIAFGTDYDYYTSTKPWQENPYRSSIWAKDLTTSAEYPLVTGDDMSARDPSLAPGGWLYYTHYDIVKHECYCPDDGWTWSYYSEENPTVYKLRIGEPGPGKPVVNMPSWFPAADPTGAGVLVTSDIDGDPAVYYLKADGTSVKLIAGGPGGFAYYPAVSFVHRTNVRTPRSSTLRAR